MIFGYWSIICNIIHCSIVFQGIGAPSSGPKPQPPVGGGQTQETTMETTPETTMETETTTESSGETTTTALDLVALGIDKEKVTAEDLCKLVKGSSRKKRQASVTDNIGDKKNAAKEGSENNNSATKEQINKGTNSSNGSQSSASNTGQNSNEAEQRSSGFSSSSSSSSGSTTPLVDLFVNPQKADVRKAFEEQTVKKYQDVFANIDLKKVIICIRCPILNVCFSGL